MFQINHSLFLRSFQIQLRHQNLTSAIHSCDIQSTDVVLHHTPVTFDVHLSEIIGTLIKGGQVALLPPNVTYDINVYSRTVSEQQVTCLNIVPSLLTTLTHYLHSTNNEDCLKTLRRIMSHGMNKSEDIFSLPIDCL